MLIDEYHTRSEFNYALSRRYPTYLITAPFFPLFPLPSCPFFLLCPSSSCFPSFPLSFSTAFSFFFPLLHSLSLLLSLLISLAFQASVYMEVCIRWFTECAEHVSRTSKLISVHVAVIRALLISVIPSGLRWRQLHVMRRNTMDESYIQRTQFRAPFHSCQHKTSISSHHLILFHLPQRYTAALRVTVRSTFVNEPTCIRCESRCFFLICF